MTIKLYDADNLIIGENYIAITGLEETKVNRTVLHYNLQTDASGSKYFSPHFYDGHFYDGHFFCGEWRSYEASGSYYEIQNLGLKSTVYNIKGIISQNFETYKSKLRNIVGTTGSIESEFIDKTTILYESVDFKENEKNFTSFNLKAIEII